MDSGYIETHRREDFVKFLRTRSSKGTYICWNLCITEKWKEKKRGGGIQSHRKVTLFRGHSINKLAHPKYFEVRGLILRWKHPCERKKTQCVSVIFVHGRVHIRMTHVIPKILKTGNQKPRHSWTRSTNLSVRTWRMGRGEEGDYLKAD